MSLLLLLLSIKCPSTEELLANMKKEVNIFTTILVQMDKLEKDTINEQYYYLCCLLIRLTSS